MKCPHCLVEFHEKKESWPVGIDIDGHWKLLTSNCPSCHRIIIHLNHYSKAGPSNHQGSLISSILIRPKTVNKAPIPKEVPEQFASDYKEACLVFADSPKASAALSRRCLQNIIHDVLKINKKDLFQEIQEIIDNKLLASDLLDNLDSIRHVGNFAAHPIKSKSTGEIVEVEPAEAEWNLDVLEMLFEYLFVRPALVKRKKDALNAKLKDAGKNPML